MKHKHHIIPIYKCKELGIDPDFEDNYAYATREQHALIHWGYYCNDLKPLLEVCNPPQEIIGLIPIGDKRDIWAAQINARGEIDGIDISGENHPMYGRTGKDHPSYGIPRSEETKKKISNNRKGKCVGKDNHNYGKTGSEIPSYTHGKLVNARNDPEVRRAYKAEWYQKNKKKHNERSRRYRARKKAEKQGLGTLEAFI